MRPFYSNYFRNPAKKKKPVTKKASKKTVTKKVPSKKKVAAKKPAIRKKEPVKAPVRAPKPEIDAFYLGKVAKYLAEAQLHQETSGKVLSLSAYARKRNDHYPSLLRALNEYRELAQPLASKEYKKLKAASLGPIYRNHVIDYLVQKELELEDRNLTKQTFAKERGLPYPTFLKYYKEYEYAVKDEVFSRLRNAKEERLALLRASPPTPPRGIRLPEELLQAADEREAKVLEKLARKKLPVRKGRPIFSEDPRENARAENAWIAIADDVTAVGLIDHVAKKWAKEPTLLLPPTIPEEVRLRLILIKIETVLRQFDLFTPFTGNLTFKQLHDWMHPAPKPQQAPVIIPPTLPTPPPAPVIQIISQGEQYDEEWLRQEIEREEQEAHRYLDTPEERAFRRSRSSIVPRQIAAQLDKSQIEELKIAGALYDEGDWLLPVTDDLRKYLVPRTTQPVIAHRPKLLVGIGTTDYTKDWMHEAFEIRTVSDPNSLRHSLLSFRPDAMMIYKSSSGYGLWNAMTHYQTETGIPVIVFDRGFSDAILSAEAQKVNWFIDAYRRRKQPRGGLRRRNPDYNWAFLARNPGFYRRRHRSWL